MLTIEIEDGGEALLKPSIIDMKLFLSEIVMGCPWFQKLTPCYKV